MGYPLRRPFDLFFGLLERHSVVESTVGLKEFEQHHKLNLKNAGKALVVTATSLECPCIFHKGEPMLVCQRNCSPLSKLSRCSDWDSGGNGLRASLQVKLGAKIAAMPSQILGRFLAQPKVCQLANQALMVSFRDLLHSLTLKKQRGR